MPTRGSGLAVAVARTTFSPKRTTAAPWACLASFPVSIESCFPPASSTEIFVASGFIGHPFVGAEGQARGHGVRVGRRMPGGGWERTLLRLTMVEPAPPEPVALLFADAELGNNGLVPFRVVLLQVVEQTTASADHHEKSAARAVVLLVRFEVFRQLTNAFAQQRDLNFRTTGIGRVRAIRVNDGLFLLSG